jgi:hypothetical protein
MTAVTCGSCGAVLAEGAGPKEDEQKPCPDCGSLARRFQLEARSMIGVGAMISAATLISGDVQSIGEIAKSTYANNHRARR